MKVLILGYGILAKEIVSQTGWDYLSRKRDGFDITKLETLNHIITDNKKYECIVNCVAHTDTYSADSIKHWDVNYKGALSLIEFCNENNIKLVHIGTDYLFANCKIEEPSEEDVPVHAENWYSYTKLLADGLVQLLSRDYLICRCTHKEYPFPFKKVFFDRVGNFDYTPKIANLIIELIKLNAKGVYNVGTHKKTLLELVIKDNPNIEKISTPIGYPKKTTMNISKMQKLINRNLS